MRDVALVPVVIVGVVRVAVVDVDGVVVVIDADVAAAGVVLVSVVGVGSVRRLGLRTEQRDRTTARLASRYAPIDASAPVHPPLRRRTDRPFRRAGSGGWNAGRGTSSARERLMTRSATWLGVSPKCRGGGLRARVWVPATSTLRGEMAVSGIRRVGAPGRAGQILVLHAVLVGWEGSHVPVQGIVHRDHDCRVAGDHGKLADLVTRQQAQAVVVFDHRRA
jgi:hypothetical protein